MVRYGELVAALRTAAAAAGLGATSHEPGQEAEIIIDAGGNPGEDCAVLDFGQSALLADIEAESGASDCALEWFTANGPIALLPHPEPKRFSLVWCGTPEDTARRLKLDPQGFVAELTATMAGAARSNAPAPGDTPSLTLLGRPYSVALTRRTRKKLVSGKVVAIGNAAQALHPVGAQGLNLGFRDSFELAQCLGDARAVGRGLGSALGQYTRSRKLDRGAVIAATDALAVAFKWPRLHPLQSLALEALAHLPLTRRALVRAFMFGLR
ncbi:MAG: FAD-dependent monooxygenase [Burkholderiaceae bacterium]|nr:FAD-dependent monooxygenase [Burkholderiaceae bacterium]